MCEFNIYILNSKKWISFLLPCLVDCVAFNNFTASASSLIMMMTRELIKLTSSILRNEKYVCRGIRRILFMSQLSAFSYCVVGRISLALSHAHSQTLFRSCLATLIFPYILLISFLISISMGNLLHVPSLFALTASPFYQSY